MCRFDLHVTATFNQLIGDWLLMPFSAPDPQVLDELDLTQRNLTLIGDKLYNAAEFESRL